LFDSKLKLDSVLLWAGHQQVFTRLGFLRPEVKRWIDAAIQKRDPVGKGLTRENRSAAAIERGWGFAAECRGGATGDSSFNWEEIAPPECVDFQLSEWQLEAMELEEANYERR
jgi:hypothetical protein